MDHQLDSKRSDLAFYSAHAAAELDNIVRKRAFNPVYLDWLSNALDEREGLFPSAPVAETHHFVDPVTANVLRQACAEAYHKTVDSFDDLREKTTDLSRAIKHLQASSDTDICDNKHVVLVRDFCLALAKYSLSVRSQTRFEQRTSPHKT